MVEKINNLYTEIFIWKVHMQQNIVMYKYLGYIVSGLLMRCT